MYDFLVNLMSYGNYWNTWIALGLYWLPWLLCIVGYIIDSYNEIREDIIRRETRNLDQYYPIITLGTLIWRAIISVVPIVNLAPTIFVHLPKFCGNFFKIIHEIFDMPLVPPKKIKS